MNRLLYVPLAACILISPNLAQASLFSSLWSRCASLLSTSASLSGAAAVGFSVGTPNSVGDLSFEIDPETFDVVVYDVSKDSSDFRGKRDSRLVLQISDDSSGASDSSNVIGFLEGSWSPNGEVLVLVDTYGNLVVIKSSDLRALRDLRAEGMSKYRDAVAQLTRHMLRLPSQRLLEFSSDVTNPTFSWLNNGSFHLRMTNRDGGRSYDIIDVHTPGRPSRLTVQPVR